MLVCSVIAVSAQTSAEEFLEKYQTEAQQPDSEILGEPIFSATLSEFTIMVEEYLTK